MKRFFCLLLSACLLVAAAVLFVGCKKTQSAGCRYEITAEYIPETATLTAMRKVEYRNAGSEEISALKFNLYPNAYREDAAYRPFPPCIPRPPITTGPVTEAWKFPAWRGRKAGR